MSNETLLAQLINPEVMADIISAKVDKKVQIMKYAKVDYTLQGQAGDTITVPSYTYIGDAVDVEEGEEIPIRKMGTTTKQYTVKMAGIGAILTDSAVLSGYGNPVGELNSQLAKSITSKIDNDAIDALYEASTSYTAGNIICYNEVVKAIDLFDEEINTDKVMFVNPKQVTQLRLDENFIAKDKYGNEVMVTGEIGMIANARIVASKKVKLVKYEKDNTNGTITIVADDVTETDTSKHLDKIMENYIGDLAVGDKVAALTTNVYVCPIVKLEEDAETEDETPALTIYLKRDTNIESERDSSRRLTEITGDKMYIAALSDETKVVLAKLNETASV